jgi:hypothetical protein
MTMTYKKMMIITVKMLMTILGKRMMTMMMDDVEDELENEEST